MTESSPRTVVIVDDDADNAAPLKLLLQMVNPCLTIFEASDGESGVEIAKKSREDVVIMDIQMPGIGGVEAAGRIRNEAADRPVLLIAVSGDVMGLPDVLATGHFDHALRKPLDLAALLKMLELA